MAKPLHSSHPAVARRRRGGASHSRRVLALAEEGHPCLDLARQLDAVEQAESRAKRVLIPDHIDPRLDDAVDQSGASCCPAMAKTRQITKYL